MFKTNTNYLRKYCTKRGSYQI